MDGKICSVRGCEGIGRLFEFPDADREPERTKIWVAAAGIDSLQNLEQAQLRCQLVCERHFEQNFVFSEKLSETAVPTLHLPAGSDSVSLLGYFKATKKNTDYRYWYDDLMSLRKSARIAQREGVSFEQRVQLMQKVVKNDSWCTFNDLNDAAKQFIRSNLMNVKCKKRSKNFTVKDKCLALALLIRSTSAYTFFYDIYTLPSLKCLQKFITNMVIEPGLNFTVLKSLKNSIDLFIDKQSDYCILMFHEIRLEPSVVCDISSNNSHGVVHEEKRCAQELNDRAIVWMLKGVENEWKQLVMYTFCKSTENIKSTYKTLIQTCNSLDLHVVASVSDQDATISKAVYEMIKESKTTTFQGSKSHQGDVIVIDNQCIVHLFDVPPLMKCMRDKLLVKDLIYTQDGKTKKAKWDHVETAYHIDQSLIIKSMPKLTDNHVCRDKINKKKVSHSLQIFSYKVASVMLLISDMKLKSKCGNYIMPCEGVDTTMLLHFMNELFDSLNGGYSFFAKKRLIIPKSFTKTTDNDNKWDSFIKVLKTMKFEATGKDEEEPVLRNLIHTLQGFKFLKRILKERGFKKFATRAFNQEPLKQVIGQIRQHAGSVRPTSHSFVKMYKVLFLKYLRNCNHHIRYEEDGISNFVLNLQELMDIKSMSQ